MADLTPKSDMSSDFLAWGEVFVDFVDAVAWPVAATVILLVFRRQLKDLIPFLKRLKAGSLEAEFDFERGVREVAESVEQDGLPNPTPTDAEVHGWDVSETRADLLRKGQLDPRSAVLEAWIRVERALDRVASNSGLSHRHKSPTALMKLLLEEQKITPTEVAVFHDLRALRNEAAHAADFSPSLSATESYMTMASRLEWALNRAALSNL